MALCNAALLLFCAPAYADCPKGEPTDVCVLQELLTNGDAAYARAEGGRRDLAAQRGRDGEYWREYVTGLGDLPKLKGLVIATCAKTAGLGNWMKLAAKRLGWTYHDDPTVALCEWWDDTHPKPVDLHLPARKGPKAMP